MTTTGAGVDAMRSVIVGLFALVPTLAAGQVPNPTPSQRYEALVKEYESASDICRRSTTTAPVAAIR